jgi:transcriptional regulator with GAF, ATPase, and Fis domain
MIADRKESACQHRLARQVDRLAADLWGGTRPTVLIGRHGALEECLEQVARFATSDSPALITGETGTGKELFARALFLLSDRHHRSFLSVNCAQYQDGQLIASELFGHKRGSFTGALADHRGLFEEGDGGVVFLDEIGELTLGAQAMLLRVLSEGEIVPVGGTQAKRVDVRVITATSRDLKPMVQQGTFRADLFYRLRCLSVVVPPLRDRGEDWELIASYFLEQLRAKRRTDKSLSEESREMMRAYPWPGNVREVRSVIDTGFHLSNGPRIEPRDFAQQLESIARADQLGRIPIARDTMDAVRRMFDDHESFWDVVHHPYLRRELSRAEVREILAQGLDRTRGSYKGLLILFNMAPTDYLKFMDFLRHQQLKPQ